jgi:type III pantothenate kinase
MLLAIDIGNTEITIGLFARTELERSWRIMTHPDRTADEWAVLLRALFTQAGLEVSDVGGSIVASVVPMTTESITDGLVDATGTVPVVVSADMLPIRLDVDEPQTVGADRMVNTLAASKLFACDTIVVDFGTATTLDCITKDGRFLGGIIAPGVRSAGENLVRKAAKLSSTDLSAPEHAIGKRTEDCIRAGLVFGTADAVDGMVRRIKSEWPTRDTPKVIATGGLAPLIAKYSSEIEEVHPDLTLQGLRIAAEWLGQAGAAS